MLPGSLIYDISLALESNLSCFAKKNGQKFNVLCAKCFICSKLCLMHGRIANTCLGTRKSPSHLKTVLDVRCRLISTI
uniref:Uncharacterized protein n=1 Tax=Poecilia latipinna TaxID=48699 RepID=A0A3B3UZ32_9TELE